MRNSIKVALALALLVAISVTPCIAQSVTPTPDPEIVQLKALANNDALISLAIDKVIADPGNPPQSALAALAAYALEPGHEQFKDALVKLGFGGYLNAPASTPTPAAQPAPVVAVQPAQPQQATTWQPPSWLRLPAWFGSARPAAQYQVSNCPPPIGPVNSGAMISATLSMPDTVLHVNASRFEPSWYARAGRAHESNFLISLATGISKAELVWNGSGTLYPMEITASGSGCHLWQSTYGSNWPSRIEVGSYGVFPDIFAYANPYGVVESPMGVPRYPDYILGLRWWDSTGEHVWVNTALIDRLEIPAELWWLDENRAAPIAPVATSALSPAPTKVPAKPAPIPADPVFNIQPDVYGQGDNQTVSVTGWCNVSWWTSTTKGSEFITPFLADKPITVTFNGTLSCWPTRPALVDLGDHDPKTVSEAIAAGVSFDPLPKDFTPR